MTSLALIVSIARMSSTINYEINIEFNLAPLEGPNFTTSQVWKSLYVRTTKYLFTFSIEAYILHKQFFNFFSLHTAVILSVQFFTNLKSKPTTKAKFTNVILNSERIPIRTQQSFLPWAQGNRIRLHNR